MSSVMTRAAPSSSMSRVRAAGSPLLVSASGGNPVLERIALSGESAYDEAWLQDLIFANSQLLPVAQIEPAFSTLIPAATEVNSGHGYIDNIYVTPTGELVLVEAKLWRNPEARRKVIAQALDYVAALQKMGFAAFEAAVMRAAGVPTGQLYGLVAAHPDAAEEAAFIDAVSRNLKRGRMLVMVVGDGIHSETEALAEMLASHAGAHFTLALVEIATYRNLETGDILAVPSTLLKTEMVERGVVIVEDGVASIRAAPTTSTPKAKSISEEMFYEQLAVRGPGLPKELQAFIASLAPYGVYTVLGSALSLKVDLPDQPRPLSLGYVQKNGQLWTDTVAGAVSMKLAMPYLAALAGLVGGVVKAGAATYVVGADGAAPRIELLLPDHMAEWREAIISLIDAARAAADAE
jgi:hypothetical protein